MMQADGCTGVRDLFGERGSTRYTVPELVHEAEFKRISVIADAIKLFLIEPLMF